MPASSLLGKRKEAKDENNKEVPALALEEQVRLFSRFSSTMAISDTRCQPSGQTFVPLAEVARGQGT